MREQVKLGELIALLERRDPQHYVCFDFGGFVPDGVDSYRGYYDQLAVGYKGGLFNVTVAQLLDLLRGAIGQTFTGYKGGDFKMSADTPLWAANYGAAPGTAIVGLADCDYMTVLATAWCD